MDRRQFGWTVLVSALVAATPSWAKDAIGFNSDRMTVTVEGKGPDVILIPGLTSSPDAWRTATPKLPGYTYHYVQVKGFAGVPAEGNAAGGLVAGVAEETARYISAAKLDRPAIVGHSMGGTVALMVAARHPDLVGRVMVVDQLAFMGMVLGPPGTTAESIKPLADQIKAGMDARTDAQNTQALSEMMGPMVANETLRPKVLEQAVASDRKVVSATFGELIVTDLRPELTKISVPATVLYVTPRGAPYTDAQTDAIYQASYANLKGVKLIHVPNSAHFIMFDNTDRFVTEMTTFLTAK